MTEQTACIRLEHSKAHLIRLEHRLQDATTRMNAAHSSGTAAGKRDYRDARTAVGRYRGEIRRGIQRIVDLAEVCEEQGADPELLEEDIEMAQIAGVLALDGDEVVPFVEDEDFLAAESAAAGFGADIIYRAHLDPLTQMLVAAGYDILDVSPEARMEAQLKELEDMGFLGDFGAETSLPRSRRARQRLKRRLERQVRRLGRRIRNLPRGVGRNRRRRSRDPITQDRYRALRRRKERVEARLEAVKASLAGDRRDRRGEREQRERRERAATAARVRALVADRLREGFTPGYPGGWQGPTGVPRPPLTTPTEIADQPAMFDTGMFDAGIGKIFDTGIVPAPRPPGLPPRPGTPVTVMPVRPGPRIPGPGVMAVPAVLEAPTRGEFMALLARATTPLEVRRLMVKIRVAIRRCKALTARYETRRNRDKARAAQLRRRITRARRRSRHLARTVARNVPPRLQTRRRRLASIIRRLASRLRRVNQRVLDHTRLLALAARAVPRYQSQLKRSQAKLATFEVAKAIQENKPDKAAVKEAEKEALEHDATVKEDVVKVVTEVSNATVVAADNEALRDAAESVQAELATKAEAGASAAELAELSQLVALLTEAINSQMPDLIKSIGEVAAMDFTPVFVPPAVPDQDTQPPIVVQAPTEILPPGPAAPLTAPTDIADVGIPVPPLSAYDIATGATRPYQVYPTGDPVGDAALAYQDEREARLNAQLALLAEAGVDISGDFGADTSFLDSHAPMGLWEDGPVDQFESGDVSMGADPWDQFGQAGQFTLTGSRPSYSQQLATAAAGGTPAGGEEETPETGKQSRSVLSFSDFSSGFGNMATGIGNVLGNILPWVTGGGSGGQPAPSPATVSNNQNTVGNAVQTMPQVIYVPGGSPMATGQGGYAGPPVAEEKNLTPLYVAGGLGLVGLGIFAWASSR